MIFIITTLHSPQTTSVTTDWKFVEIKGKVKQLHSEETTQNKLLFFNLIYNEENKNSFRSAKETIFSREKRIYFLGSFTLFFSNCKQIMECLHPFHQTFLSLVIMKEYLLLFIKHWCCGVMESHTFTTRVISLTNQ